MRSHHTHATPSAPRRTGRSHARGFAAMDPEQHRRVSALGGQHSHSGSQSDQETRSQPEPDYQSSRSGRKLDNWGDRQSNGPSTSQDSWGDRQNSRQTASQDNWSDRQNSRRDVPQEDWQDNLGKSSQRGYGSTDFGDRSRSSFVNGDRSRYGSNFRDQFRDQDFIDRRFSGGGRNSNRDVDFNSRFDDRDEQIYSGSPGGRGYDRANFDDQVGTSANLRGQYNYGRNDGPEEDYDNPYTARDYTQNEDDTDWRVDQYDPRESRFAEGYQGRQGSGRSQDRYQGSNQDSFRRDDRGSSRDSSRRNDRDDYNDNDQDSFVRYNSRRY